MQFDFMAARDSRPRTSAVILRKGGAEVLMVQHSRRDGTFYWQLPGGGIENGERAQDAILRELLEETGLHGRVVRWLFSIPYRLGSSTTFLVEIDEDAEMQLGIDPEEVGNEHQKLVGLAWRRVDEVQESPEVRMMGIVLSYLEWRDEGQSTPDTP